MGLPNVAQIQATQAGYLPFHDKSSATATKTHVFPGIKSSSLISIGQLCDDDCTAVLDRKWMKIYENNEIVLYCSRNLTDGLWDISIPTEPTQLQANVTIRKDKTKYGLAQCLHACTFSPVPSTLQKAMS